MSTSVQAFDFNLSSYCPIATNTERCADNIYDQFEDADIKLNLVYNQIMSGSKLTKDDKARLRKAELNWIVFKDNYCNFMVNVKPSQDRLVYNIVIHSCELELTINHTRRLQELL
jgi:uncharacterized protein YecT (DUF1311 family)